MPLELADSLPLWIWFPLAVLKWLLVVAGVVTAAVLIGWLVSALQRGPMAGLRAVGRTLAAAAADLLRISPRRVWALG